MPFSRHCLLLISPKPFVMSLTCASCYSSMENEKGQQLVFGTVFYLLKSKNQFKKNGVNIFWYFVNDKITARITMNQFNPLLPLSWLDIRENVEENLWYLQFIPYYISTRRVTTLRHTAVFSSPKFLLTHNSINSNSGLLTLIRSCVHMTIRKTANAQCFFLTIQTCW